jgi:uncharacterized DUF497 family protein
VAQNAATTTAERRYVTVGLVKGLLIAVISTLRGSAIRIISARAAGRKERNFYGSENSKENP